MAEQIADCDWSGWDSNNTKRGDFGAVALIDATKKLANTMINFPKKADGMYEHIVKTKEGLEVVAKLKVVRWIPQPKVVQQATNGAVKATPVVIIPVAEPKETPALDMGDDGEVVLEL